MHDQIIAALLEWNPWLENGQLLPKLVGIPRLYDLIPYTTIPEIKILEGVRRSGKSTLLYQVLAHALETNKKVLYINFDDELLKRYTLAEIYYVFLSRQPIDYLLIDEVQQCSDWVPFIRKMYDRKELEQIWITGSNSTLIKREYAELLTGRNIKLSIAPLSFAEYLRFKGEKEITLPVSPQRKSAIIKLFIEYRDLGAFPAIALRDVLQRELLNNYFEDFIYKDIASRHEVNVSKLKELAIYHITHSTKLFSHRRVAEALQIHSKTISDYLSYMQEVFLMDEIYKYDHSLKNQYSNDRKLYVVDTGLANAVSFQFSENKGRMLETIVYHQLKRKGLDIYFHRNKKECDFILKNGLNIVAAIQVSHSLLDPDTKTREIAGLLEALKTYHLIEGLILTFDENDEWPIVEDNCHYKIQVRPVWQWLLE
jgi:predicted AAA+ superfamily ATPase